jgi:hypothetical protein
MDTTTHMKQLTFTKNSFFMFNVCFSCPTQKLLAEVLSNVIEKTFLSITHSCSKLSILLTKDVPLCGGTMNEKLNTLLDNT